MPDSEAVQITRRPRCERERMRGGWFDPSDLTNNTPPVTVDLDVTVFGQDVAISPDVDFLQLGFFNENEPSIKRAQEATLQRAMAHAHARLVEGITRPPGEPSVVSDESAVEATPTK
jgi:hypothetical protein